MTPFKGKIRLSHSALDVFHKCERLFQLNRLLTTATDKEDYPATVMGHAFGAGVASYLLHQDKDRAVLETYLRYWPVVEDEKRSETQAINLLLNAIPHLDNLLQDYEVAIFNGKPAVELSFRLDIDDVFYYVGYIDIVLRNKWNGVYAIMENKTTAMNLYDISCMYQNSGQALGYSIILDQIAGENKTDYEVLYFVGQLGSGNGYSPKIHTLPFPKTLSDRFNWFISLQMDVNSLTEMLSLNIFPMRGSSCLQYMKPCQHFGSCSLHGFDEYKIIPEDEIEYDFIYKLDEVIADHMIRINA